MFYRIEPDIYAKSGILEEPSIPGFNDTFITGAKLVGKPPVPLAFRSNFDKNNPPRGFEGMTIPVWSHDFVALLRNIGINNFDIYDAVINGDDGTTWNNYYAVNVLGSVAAADLSKSRFTKITDSPNGIPMVGFHDLVIDVNKVKGLDMFRLQESLSTLVVSERVTMALKQKPIAGGWGVTAFPIEEA